MKDKPLQRIGPAPGAGGMAALKKRIFRAN